MSIRLFTSSCHRITLKSSSLQQDGHKCWIEGLTSEVEVIIVVSTYTWLMFSESRAMLIRHQFEKRCMSGSICCGRHSQMRATSKALRWICSCDLTTMSRSLTWLCLIQYKTGTSKFQNYEIVSSGGQPSCFFKALRLETYDFKALRLETYDFLNCIEMWQKETHQVW